MPSQPASEEELAAEQDYPEAPPAERDAEAEEAVAKLLDYFLSSMGVVAETFVRDELDSGSLVFEIEGPDAGLLIGRRGETLQALQFIVRMVTNRQLGRKSYVIIDVEGYRERRADMLRNLARRTGGRVGTSGRPASLEPMPPGERRIIHMALADNPRVRTESEGEGNRRRVVILPRRAGAPNRGPRDDNGSDRAPREDRGPRDDRAPRDDRGPEDRAPREEGDAAPEEGGRTPYRQRRNRRGYGRRGDGPQEDRPVGTATPSGNDSEPSAPTDASVPETRAAEDNSGSEEERR